jgi:hypothetical protein
MSWSTGYSPMYWAGIINYGNYLYVYTTDTITQTNLTTGTITNSSWASGLGNVGGYFAIDGGYLYATNIITVGSDDVGIVYKITINDSSVVETFFNTSLVSPVGLIIYNGYLYVASSGSNYISKISLTNPSSDYDINWFSSDLINNPVGLLINGDYMYVTNTAGGEIGIHTIYIPTKQLTFIHSSPSVILFDMTIYENSLYVSNTSDYIIQFDLSGNVLNSTYAYVPSNSDGLIFNGGYLYVVSYSDTSVYRYSTTSSDVTCFGENTKILCYNGETSKEEYIQIKDIRKGTLVKTLMNGYVAVHAIGKSTIQTHSNNERIKNRLYKCTKEKYPEIGDDEHLILTGCHSILVDSLTEEQREKTIQEIKQVYVTDRKYRLLTFLDPRAEPYQVAGEMPIYHFALENENYYMNYGVYANGLLVESCSRRYLKELSGMTLIE